MSATSDDTDRAGLLDGVQHVALLTADTDRLVRFYEDVFGATVDASQHDDGFRLTFVSIGPGTELNVFELAGNDQAGRQTPMFERGRLDHLGLRASSVDAFDEIRRRLTAVGASDGFVTDFGPVLSLFFTDPDGLEGEVCVMKPEPVDRSRRNPPGTPAAGYGAE